MTARRRFRKRQATQVVAVRLDLDTDGFSYRKWGGVQTCKAGDWIVDNAGEVHTVDAESFARTYRAVGAASPGRYEKVAPVWAEVAPEAGQIATKEGVTHYPAGAYLVYNDAEARDGYAVEAAVFERQYEPLA